MKILLLGGTRFLGRHLAEQAIAAGHDVTLLHRGQSGPTLFPQARGSNFENQIIGLPLSSAPCDATNRPCTWKIGSAWISTSPGCQPQ